MPIPIEALAGPAAAVAVLVWIVNVLWGAYKERQAKADALHEERHANDAETIRRLIGERDLALTGWREQTALTNAAVAAFAEERRDRNARHRGDDGQ